jgi:hypothetical protein
MVRRKDWAATPLGPRDSWRRSLNNYLSMIFELPTATIIFLGAGSDLAPQQGLSPPPAAGPIAVHGSLGRRLS